MSIFSLRESVAYINSRLIEAGLPANSFRRVVKDCDLTGNEIRSEIVESAAIYVGVELGERETRRLQRLYDTSNYL